MNIFIAIRNDALMNAKTCASENELYDLLDENWSQKEGENKRIFDAKSESIKQQKGNSEDDENRDKELWRNSQQKVGGQF